MVVKENRDEVGKIGARGMAGTADRSSGEGEKFKSSKFASDVTSVSGNERSGGLGGRGGLWKSGRAKLAGVAGRGGGGCVMTVEQRGGGIKIDDTCTCTDGVRMSKKKKKVALCAPHITFVHTLVFSPCYETLSISVVHCGVRVNHEKTK